MGIPPRGAIVVSVGDVQPSIAGDVLQQHHLSQPPAAPCGDLSACRGQVDHQVARAVLGDQIGTSVPGHVTDEQGVVATTKSAPSHKLGALFVND